MLANYFSIAFRNLSKYKIFSFINIAGMGISLASCILIALFVWEEINYDSYHPAGDRTFRIYNIRSGNDGVTNYLPIVPNPFGPYIQKEFPEVENTMRFMDTYGEVLLEANGKKIMQRGGIYAEPNIFDMLSIPVLKGNGSNALEKINAIALSRSVARTFFGDEEAVGKTILLDGRPRDITAVFEDSPRQSHLKVDFMISFSTLTQNWNAERFENWQWQQFFTYVRLKPNTDAKAFEAKLLPFVKKYAYPKIEPQGFIYVPHIQNIRDIHLHSSNFEWEIAQRGDAQSVYILIGSGIMILIIACLNFINLSTARSVKRMKEVGVRKVIGAQRKQLIFQFIIESVLFTLSGMFLAIVLAELSLPLVNGIIDKNLSLPYSLPYIVSSLLFCVLLGAIAGSYPAFHLSRFKPALVLSGKNNSKGSFALFRQSLVVLQFMLSFFLVMGSWIILSQNQLIHSKDLGFNKEQVVVIPLRDAQLKNPETTKQRFSNNPGVISATIGFGLPGDIIAGDEIVEPSSGKTYGTNLICADHDYISTLGMKVIAGRNFSHDFPSDSSEAFIFNESALAAFGYGSPQEAIGKRVDWKRWDRKAMKQGHIIGVVKDFHFKSLRDKLSPVVIHLYPKAYWKIALRIKAENMAETLAYFKKTYEELDPQWIYTYSFLDENFDKMYKSEERLGKLFTIFTYLTIVVACMGLFGLVEYSVNQRTKEISIRKVFGASVSSLLILLTKRYFLLLFVAIALVTPLCLYAANEWLSKFAYHIDVNPLLFIKATAMIVGVTFLTVIFQCMKAAFNNPAPILKND
jgi:putative ABC transport system permease protein